MHLIRVSEEAFFTTDKPAVVGPDEIAQLKALVNSTARKRIRICTHPNVSDRHHEMFIAYTRDTNMKPNKHLAKDETVTVLEGEGDLIFYNDTGDVLQIIPLGPYGSGRAFYARIPADTWHAIVASSDILVMHEATPGPYIREHTVWAGWK